MRTAVGVAWSVTAAVGIYLLVIWLSGDGLRRQPARITACPAALVVAHPLLAVTGLVCWGIYAVRGGPALAWGAFALLAATSLLGFMMLTRWLVGRGGRHARGAGRPFPLTAVLAHAGAGLTTFVLALIAASVASHH